MSRSLLGKRARVDEILGLGTDARGDRDRRALDSDALFDAREFPVGQLDRTRMSSRPMTSPPASCREGPVVVFDFDNYYMGGVLPSTWRAAATRSPM